MLAGIFLQQQQQAQAQQQGQPQGSTGHKNSIAPTTASAADPQAVAAHTPRSHTGTTARSARGGPGAAHDNDGGPFAARSLQQLAASLPPNAFKATVPALYRHGGGAGAGGSGAGDTYTAAGDDSNTAPTSDSRAEADRAAGGGGDATDKARLALEARARADAQASKHAAADGVFGCVRKTVLRGPPYGACRVYCPHTRVVSFLTASQRCVLRDHTSISLSFSPHGRFLCSTLTFSHTHSLSLITPPLIPVQSWRWTSVVCGACAWWKMCRQRTTTTFWPPRLVTDHSWCEVCCWAIAMLSSVCAGRMRAYRGPSVACDDFWPPRLRCIAGSCFCPSVCSPFLRVACYLPPLPVACGVR
jgi:hypothetical protein